MRFIKIEPRVKTLSFINANSPTDAFDAFGLGGADFTGLGGPLHMMVYEYGLLKEINEGYFSIGLGLFAGRAIVFKVDSKGETIDANARDMSIVSEHTTFFRDADAAEAAIEAGQVRRPVTSINGLVTWQWAKHGNQ